MNLALFYDTETTGFLKKSAWDDPDQPHVVQIAAALVDLVSRKTVASMDVIIKPDGWEVPESASNIHGITTAEALRVGIDAPVAIDMLLALWGGRPRIGHNEPFDAGIIGVAMTRYGPGAMLHDWRYGPGECTMRRYASEFNCGWPKLSYAYEKLTRKPMINAHTAMADVQACIEVYFALVDA